MILVFFLLFQSHAEPKNLNQYGKGLSKEWAFFNFSIEPAIDEMREALSENQEKLREKIGDADPLNIPINEKNCNENYKTMNRTLQKYDHPDQMSDEAKLDYNSRALFVLDCLKLYMNKNKKIN